MANTPRKKPRLSLSTRWNAPSNPLFKRIYAWCVVVSLVLATVSAVLDSLAGFNLPWAATVAQVCTAALSVVVTVGGLVVKLSVNWDKLRRRGFFLLPLLLLGLSGCMTYEKAVRKWGHLAKDSVIVEKTVAVQVPKDSVTWAIDNATLQQWLGKPPVGTLTPDDMIRGGTVTSTPAIDFFAQNGRARLHVSRPAQRAGQTPAPIQFRAICDTVTITKTVRVASPPAVTFRPNHRGWQVFALIGWVIAGVLFLLIWLDRRTRRGQMPEYTPPVLPDFKNTPPPPSAPPADRVIREGQEPPQKNS